MQEFTTNLMSSLTEPKTCFILCGLFIAFDIITGYLKAFITVIIMLLFSCFYINGGNMGVKLLYN